MDHEHVCWWTRRKQSEITDDGTSISGAGLPRPCLESAARLLGCNLTARPSATDEYGEEIALGTFASGWTHDDCFFQLLPVSPKLKEALLESLLELHARYLGRDVDWTRVVPALL